MAAEIDEMSSQISELVVGCKEASTTYAGLTDSEKATYKADIIASNTNSCPLKPAPYVAPSIQSCNSITLPNFIKGLSFSVLKGGVTCSNDAECEAKTCYSQCTRCFEKAKCDGELKNDFAASTEKVCTEECPAIIAASLSSQEPSCTGGSSKTRYTLVSLMVIAIACLATF